MIAHAAGFAGNGLGGIILTGRRDAADCDALVPEAGAALADVKIGGWT